MKPLLPVFTVSPNAPFTVPSEKSPELDILIKLLPVKVTGPKSGTVLAAELNTAPPDATPELLNVKA